MTLTHLPVLRSKEAPYDPACTCLEGGCRLPARLSDGDHAVCPRGRNIPPRRVIWIGTQAPFCRAMRNAQELCRQNPIISGVCRCQESPRNHPKAPPSTIHALEEMLGLRAQTVDYLQARLSLSRNAPIKNPTLTLSE